MEYVILGIGTGRCGTMSLAKLLNHQNYTTVKHEWELMPWNINPKAFTKKSKMIENVNNKYVGEVAYYLLPYLKRFFQKYKDNLKIIALQRSREKTVQSYLDKTGRKSSRDRHHWYNHGGKRWDKDPKWDPTYPNIGIKNKREAIEEYYDQYYNIVEQWENKYPHLIKLFPTDNLNSSKGQSEILEFIGLEKYIHLHPCRYNKIRER